MYLFCDKSIIFDYFWINVECFEVINFVGVFVELNVDLIL